MVHMGVRVVGAGLVLALAIVSCDDDDGFGSGVRGSGEVTTEEREVSGFDSIVLLGSGDVIVDVDGTESLVIEAEDNILPLLTSDVRGGRLELGASENISPTEGITYTIGAARLEGFEIAGSGAVVATNLGCSTLDASITGSGSIDVEGGCDAIDVTIAGSGEYEGADLVAATGSVAISGSGSALVNVTDDLDVTVSGSGDVEYLGDPNLAETISGSGSVSPR